MKLAALFVIALAVSAQMRDNHEKKLSCQDNNRDDRQRFCKVVEQSLPVLGRLSINPGQNGGVMVKGWSQNQTLVRARIDAWAETESEASLIGGQVNAETAGGQIRATGPQSRGKSNWSVSYEIFVPHTTDLELSAHNGGIHITDVRGRMEFKTVNGGVHLTRVAGDINGSTQNGGVHVELIGNSWEGGQMDVRTVNGGVHLALPSQYSARLKVETANGGIHSEFPLPATTERRPRSVDFTVGSGGPLLQLTTRNGGVHVQRN